jgi:alpha-L-fucosidase
VFTTKHHDGFCMFDSHLTDYTIMHSPFRRDVLKELADACHEADFGLGLYYSPPDWHYGQGREPKPYQEYFHGQMQELCNRYGKVDVLWFDMAGGAEWGTEKLLPLIRQWQPHVLLDDRLGGAPGDFSTREGGIGQIELKRPWESCITLQHYQFSWNPNSRVMPAKEVIHTLIRVVSAGGNLLLNLGPMPTGQFDPRQIQVLEEVGKWLKANGESVYGTQGGPFVPSLWVLTTQKDRKIFVHALDWPRDIVHLPVLDQTILSASRLSGEPVSFKQTAQGVELSVPADKHDPQDTVIVLELAGLAADLPARKIPLGTLSDNKQYSASGCHRNEEGLSAAKAFDGDPSTRWAAPEDAETAWLTVDLGAEMTFDRVYVDEHARRVLHCELQVKEADAWRTFHQGEKLGERRFITFPPVKGRQVRLLMSRFVAPPTIWEFQILESQSAK